MKTEFPRLSEPMVQPNQWNTGLLLSFALVFAALMVPFVTLLDLLLGR